MARVRAVFIHFLGSILLALVALFLVFKVWYPSPLAEAVGVASIFLLVLGVDVVLGPLLTFVVYKPGKRSLRFDLSCIVIVQLIAFMYGIWTVAEGRPAWMVYNAGRFDLVQAYELDTRNLDKTDVAFRAPSWQGPQWVAAKIPEDAQARSDLTIEAVFSGLDVAQRPNLYVPIESMAESIRKHTLPLDMLRKYNDSQEVDAALSRSLGADGWLPLMSRVKPMVVLVNKERAEVIGVVALNPWN